MKWLLKSKVLEKEKHYRNSSLNFAAGEEYVHHLIFSLSMVFQNTELVPNAFSAFF